MRSVVTSPTADRKPHVQWTNGDCVRLGGTRFSCFAMCSLSCLKLDDDLSRGAFNPHAIRSMPNQLPPGISDRMSADPNWNCLSLRPTRSHCQSRLIGPVLSGLAVAINDRWRGLRKSEHWVLVCPCCTHRLIDRTPFFLSGWAHEFLDATAFIYCIQCVSKLIANFNRHPHDPYGPQLHLVRVQRTKVGRACRGVCNKVLWISLGTLRTVAGGWS